MSAPQKLRIAVLDDYHDLAPSALSTLLPRADIQIFRDTILPTPDPAALIARLKPFSVLCTMRERTPLPQTVLSQLPNLKIILTTGMGNRGIDMEWCKAHDVPVCGTPAAALYPPNPNAVQQTVQHTWALILALADHVPRDQELITRPVPDGKTYEGHHPSTWGSKLPMNLSLPGLTFGTMGLGRLGLGAARIAVLAWGMKVIAWSPNLTQEKADDAAEKSGLPKGTFEVVDKLTLFARSDILSIHMVLSERSKGIVGKEDLARMNPTSLLINTSRGPLIDEEALLDTLEQGRIAGAGLDVFDVEPLPMDSRWRTTKWGEGGRSEVVMTPHTGYSFTTTFKEWWEITRRNLEGILDGKEPEHRIV